MGKIEFANCQDVRNQKKIQELDCPRCLNWEALKPL